MLQYILHPCKKVIFLLWGAANKAYKFHVKEYSSQNACL